MAAAKVRIAVVGLGFGAEFVPIYLAHPDVERVAIVDPDEQVLKSIGDRFQIGCRFTRLADIIGSPDYNAVHLITPIPLHAHQTVAVLEAGKHCACTVPMATSVADCWKIIVAQRTTKKNYMMMETAVYTRQFLFVKDLLVRGEMGEISFLRGAHYQDMTAWPHYWMGLPPMHYATHAVSPLLALANTRATKVHCFGSGHLEPELQKQYNNPYPVETAIFQLEGTNVAAEVTRSLFQTARTYTESFAVYAEKASFEWQQLEEEDPIVFTMGPIGRGRERQIAAARVVVPDRQDLLPREIAHFTQRSIYSDVGTHLSFSQGGGHGGSHPHLVHEFIRSIVEERPPAVDHVTAANWTAAGICAHESAVRNGDAVSVPCFTNSNTTRRVSPELQ